MYKIESKGVVDDNRVVFVNPKNYDCYYTDASFFDQRYIRKLKLARLIYKKAKSLLSEECIIRFNLQIKWEKDV